MEKAYKRNIYKGRTESATKDRQNRLGSKFVQLLFKDFELNATWTITIKRGDLNNSTIGKTAFLCYKNNTTILLYKARARLPGPSFKK